LFTFLLTTVAISFSGVMAPGPMTVATLAAGGRSRHAGAIIALGHAVIEMPLIVLSAAGVGRFLAHWQVRTGIGLAGGVVLALLGLQLLLNLRAWDAGPVAPVERHPLMTGIALTAANPYFLVWWATVGLALAVRSLAFGAWMLGLFAVVHWLCDLVWLEVLSLLGFKGSEVFGKRAQIVVSGVCAVALLCFAAKFLYDAGVSITST
jgi:threonine/homoserine/homoserine lactone efflux protein